VTNRYPHRRTIYDENLITESVHSSNSSIALDQMPLESRFMQNTFGEVGFGHYFNSNPITNALNRQLPDVDFEESSFST
jgi:hypothetical protein